jgi:hypothetical protein
LLPDKEDRVTFVWFVVWFICDRIGDRERLTFDPVNWWAGTLLLMVALDLSKHHPKRFAHRRRRES